MDILKIKKQSDGIPGSAILRKALSISSDGTRATMPMATLFEASQASPLITLRKLTMELYTGKPNRQLRIPKWIQPLHGGSLGANEQLYLL